LRAGVRSVEQRRALDNLVGAFERRDRVLVPTLSAFLEAGRVLSDLAVREQFTHGPGTRSLLNDALIATTCREAQVTLATDNHDHFSRIRRHLRGFRFVAPDSIV
jgi:predicted nucleic acid-binding protein